MSAAKAQDRASPVLRELAELAGIQTQYEDRFGQTCYASTEALLRGLRILGADIRDPADAGVILQARRRERWYRCVEPVLVAWEGQGSVALRCRTSGRRTFLGGLLTLEDGTTHELSWRLDQAEATERSVVDDVEFATLQLPLPALPWGYHRLALDMPDSPNVLVIAAPTRAYSLGATRSWGVFLPLYALHSDRSWGIGDFADLERLTAEVGGRGGGIVATLPLLAAFLDEPLEVSPYSPVSRLFWNEIFLAVDRIPEVAVSPSAHSLLDSDDIRVAIATAQGQRLVDYRGQMALKRRVLSLAARDFFATDGERRKAFDRFVALHPYADDYARFRAVGERLRTPWPRWPASLRDGGIGPADFDEEARRYHLFVQWQADEQMQRLSHQARGLGPGLYLDLPLGTNENGYDTWRERGSFALDAAGGCPPDPGFPLGQNWGFSPLHPEGIRQDGYRYVRAFLHHQFQYAGLLRIDHMPVLHRLYWVPRGLDARDGIYVRYHADELYALFTLESHRNRTTLVGEDLGTVPPEVPAAMARHDIRRMYVVQYELQPIPDTALAPVPEGAVASVNTHDMAPFAAFVRGLDIDLRASLGLLGDQNPDHERDHRRNLIQILEKFLHVAPEASATDLLRACLKYLAASDAGVILVSLEDLWDETQPQNVPSTVGERPNWRQRARHSLDQIPTLPQVTETLRMLNEWIKKSVNEPRTV